jgi:hypothetical protein
LGRPHAGDEEAGTALSRFVDSAKIHCASDEDSEQDLVDFQVEQAIATCLEGLRKEFTEHVVEFALGYAVRVREDHALFVDAFREARIGISAT